jgi:hypothetical protein
MTKLRLPNETPQMSTLCNFAKDLVFRGVCKQQKYLKCFVYHRFTSLEFLFYALRNKKKLRSKLDANIKEKKGKLSSNYI